MSLSLPSPSSHSGALPASISCECPRPRLLLPALSVSVVRSAQPVDSSREGLGRQARYGDRQLTVCQVQSQPRRCVGKASGLCACSCTCFLTPAPSIAVGRVWSTGQVWCWRRHEHRHGIVSPSRSVCALLVSPRSCAAGAFYHHRRRRQDLPQAVDEIRSRKRPHDVRRAAQWGRALRR